MSKNRFKTFWMVAVLLTLGACAASTDWNNPCDKTGSNYNVTECAKKQGNNSSNAPAVNIPGGCFNMGDAFNEGVSNELPVHNVCVSPFVMDTYEVTNGTYRACVNDGACTAPSSTYSETRSDYYGNSVYDDFPVTDVNWNQASAFCRWVTGRLPTEAEWEYAARGGLAGKRYPWGNEAPVCTLGAENGAQHNGCNPGDTTAVGSFAPNGYGLYDMAGNVWEWVYDRYAENYYSVSPAKDPPGPSSGDSHVLRGGSFRYDTGYLRAAYRGYDNGTINLLHGAGFRCVQALPFAPSGLTATVVSGTQVNLYWVDNSIDEDGFSIQRKTLTSAYAQVGTVSANVTGYQDTGLTCDTDYFYRVTAALGAGGGDSSNEVSVTTGACSGAAVPAAPSGLTVYPGSLSSEVDLAWQDNSNNEDGFKIERKTGSGGTHSLVYTAGPNVTSYTDNGLSAGTAYYYRVYAYNSAGNSGYSDEANATTRSFSIQTAAIPAGCYNIGDAFGDGRANESPVHNVCLSAFKMNVYEVTNAQYKACVDAASCTAPGDSSSNTRSLYYGNATYDNYPVIYVDWDQSKSFCQWTGGRLPTEAEWEYAARGGLSGKRYPWGDDAPTCTLGATNGVQNGMCSPQDTIAVGSFAPNGYGLYDMAGNVWEWVKDWYSDTYYSSSPTQDPQGPSSGSVRVLRGGCWGISDPFNIRASVRGSNVQTYEWKYYGFRCVR